MLTEVETPAWVILKTQLTDKDELKIADLLARVNKWKLKCRNLEERLSKKFNISKLKVDNIIGKFFSLGIIGKFDVAEIVDYRDGMGIDKYTKTQINTYWLFNPYLCYQNIPEENTDTLFDNTWYAKVMK